MKRSGHYDVIVVGGGASGLAAAIGAKNAGKTVLLLDRNGSLGGQCTNSNVASYCGFFNRGDRMQQIIFGIGDEVLRKLRKIGYYDRYQISPAGNAIITLDIEATKYALDLIAADHQLEYLLHCRVVEALMNEDGTVIEGVKCVDDEGYFEFSADAFVDASGDGNLGYLANAPYRFGDGNGSVQMSTRILRIDHVDPSVQFTPDNLEKVFLRAKSEGFNHLTKESGMVVRTHEDTIIALLPSIAVSALDAKTLTECEVDTMSQAIEYMKAFRKYMPGMENARLVWSGASMGIRDTRHLKGEYQLTGDDILSARKQEDAIACGAWPCEIHKELNKMAQYTLIPENDWYEIPLRCLKVKKIKNLWSSGRIIDVDPIAFASVRVMGIGFATGHAAGVAAAIVKNGIADTKLVQEELLRQNAKI